MVLSDFPTARAVVAAETGKTMQLPSVHVYEEKDDVVNKAKIRLSKEDISVQISESTLTIKGERNWKKRSKRTTTTVVNGPLAHVPGRLICPET